MIELDGPRQPPAAGPARQLVVLAHGLGADGHDLMGLADAWAAALPHAAFAAPNAPEPCDMAPMGRQWFSLADRTPARILAGIAAAASTLAAFVDAELARLGLPREACALAGFSQGAMTVLHAGLRLQPPPRALVVCSGRLLDPVVPPGPHPPVLLVHGESDSVVPVEGSREAEAALSAAGVAVEALYIPRLGHGIDDTGVSRGARFLRQAFSRPGD